MGKHIPAQVREYPVADPGQRVVAGEHADTASGEQADDGYRDQPKRNFLLADEALVQQWPHQRR